MARGDRAPALHQQLPGVHRAHLPGTVRGGVRPQHQRRSGHDQEHREEHHRPRLRGRLGDAAGSRAPHRQEGGGRRLGTRRARLRAAAGARRPCGDAVRARRPRRRPAALRDSRLQDGEVADRPAHGADGGRGGDLPHRRARGRRGRRRRAAARLPRHRPLHRRDATARPAGARSRAARHPLRHGVPAAAEQGGRRGQHHGTDPRPRPPRRDPRRRRHGIGLPRHVEPPRRDVGAPVRAASPAARPTGPSSAGPTGR